MGFSIRVRPEHALGVVTLTDHVDGDAVIRALRALVSHPDWTPGFDAAWDARYLRVFDLVPTDLPAFTVATKALATRLGGGRSAVLGRGPYDEVTVRLLELRGRSHPDHDLRAFVSRREAAWWLGVPDHAFDQGVDSASAPPPRHGAGPWALMRLGLREPVA
ncbi:MAG TPA: hypothetical protein VK610_00595 [Rhodothermales bacterium]|nr:hypothetical protein [Rhodothermales bacterium]